MINRRSGECMCICHSEEGKRRGIKCFMPSCCTPCPYCEKNIPLQEMAVHLEQHRERGDVMKEKELKECEKLFEELRKKFKRNPVIRRGFII